MKFSLIIPTINSSENLKSLLASCRGQTYDANEFEILIIHSHKFNPSLDQNFKNIRFEKCLERNVSKARNIGVALAAGKYVLFLDDDVILPTPDFLSCLSDNLNELSESDLLGGPYVSPLGSRPLTFVSNLIANLWLESGIIRKNKSLYEGQFLLGGNLCSSKENFLNCPFPEEIPWGGEDSVFIQNCRSRGSKIYYAPQLEVVHNTIPSLKKFILRSWLSGRTSAIWKIPTANNKSKLKILWRYRFKGSLSYLPLILLHLIFVESSKLIYKFLLYIPNYKSRLYQTEKVSNTEAISLES